MIIKAKAGWVLFHRKVTSNILQSFSGETLWSKATTCLRKPYAKKTKFQSIGFQVELSIHLLLNNHGSNECAKEE